MRKYVAMLLAGWAVLGGLPESAAAEKLKIAVVDFGILGITQEESKQLTQVFRDVIAKNPNFEVLPRDLLEEVFRTEDTVTKIRMEQYECINQEMYCASRIGQKTGAERVLVGRIIKQKTGSVILAKVIDNHERDLEFEASEEGPADADLNKMAAALAQKVDKWLPRAGETKEAAKKRRDAEQLQEETARQKRLEERRQELAKRAPGTCPDGIVLVAAGEFTMGSNPSDPDRYKGEPESKKVKVAEFCIDMFEFPNKKGGIPMANVQWFAAKEECEKQGKYLCSEAEWEKACKGTQGLKFPYGNSYDPTKCSTAKDSKNPGKLIKLGDMADCKSGYGAFDMSGNLTEWTSDMDPDYSQVYIAKGGSFKSEAKDSRCASRKKSVAIMGQNMGFRCCK